MSNRSFPSTVNSIPKKPFYAIITGSTIYVPGDERSRSCPGHGYPAHTENHLNMEAYEDEAEWKKEILNRMNSEYGNKKFMACKIIPANINTEISVNIDV